jgi:galactokinase
LITLAKLDTLVACAQEQPGVLGARMTGAGFGGCSIALVPKQNIDAFIEAVGQSYQDKTPGCSCAQATKVSNSMPVTS